MAEAVRRSVVSTSSTSSAGGSIDPFLVMEDINEKLKLLNYEKELLSKRPDLKPLSRIYFAIQTKPSEQFPYFSYLVSYLFQCIGIEILEWNEYDDPNTISMNILEQLRKLGFQQDFPASKLRHGAGDSVCVILDFLCDKALAARRFHVSSPIYTNNDNNNAELNDQTVEQEDEENLEQQDAINDEIDEAEDANDLDAAVQSNLKPGVKGNRENEMEEKQPAILESKVTAAEWHTQTLTSPFSISVSFLSQLLTLCAFITECMIGN
jgi:estrogen-related receptor beta like 1